MEEINKKQMYYLLISTIFHQSQNTNTTLQNSLKLVEELEKKNYICTERELTDLFYKQGIKHRFPNKMIDYLDSTFDTLKYDFKDINNVFQVTNFIELKNNLLKFKGKEILNGMSVARGFAVLYNYCKNVEFAKKWYMDNKGIIGTKITLDEVEKLFLFGQIVE